MGAPCENCECELAAAAGEALDIQTLIDPTDHSGSVRLPWLDGTGKRGKTFIFVLVLAFAILGTLQHIQDAYKAFKSGPDKSVRLLQRYEPLYRHVGSSHNLGYVSDEPFDPGHLTGDQMIPFCLAQYALAPRVIRISIGEDIVIGDYFQGRPDVQQLAQQHLRVEQDLGNGLLILRRK